MGHNGTDEMICPLGSARILTDSYLAIAIFGVVESGSERCPIVRPDGLA